MSKRSHEVYSRDAASRFSQPPSLSDQIDDNDQPSSRDAQSQSFGKEKKPRNFIASVACETCRLKKTRCDESRPRCGLCRSLGQECVYKERKSSKKDHSLSLLMSTLHRLETKMDNIPALVGHDMQSTHSQLLQALQTLNGSGAVDGRISSRMHRHMSSAHTPHSIATPLMTTPEDLAMDDGHPDTAQSAGRVSISFSQHGVISWPGVQEILPKPLLAAYESLGRNYVIDTEKKRAPLPMYIRPYPPQAEEDEQRRWLEALPLALIKGLSDAFFATFNPFTPIMDKNFYFSLTLGSAIESGFGYTMESCLVLSVMALGCLAIQAHYEGDFPLPGNSSRSQHFEPPDWMSVIHEEPPGLRFFNEARRRIGFLMCDNDLQSCQFYLLSSIYYSQILRPMDWWAMIHRAATCCLSMLTNQNINFDDWEGDMKSRVFWNCLMNETILIQELPLPPSGLARLEEYVPIPKFIGFETTGLVVSAAARDADDSVYQYHFLAQVAHRIILTRIRHSLYIFSDSGTLPLPAVNAELHHQLEQWRVNLPPALQFDDPSSSNPPLPPPPTSSSCGSSPASAIASAMLLGRYKIAKFHIGRPYLYKALRTPESLTEADLEQVSSGLRHAMHWPIVGGIFQRMKSCIPIGFAFCSQFFGQILLFYCLSHSPYRRVRDCLPAGWEGWSEEMMRFLEDCAPASPAVAQDLELLRLLAA